MSQQQEPQAGAASRKGALITLGLIAGSLLWYVIADRTTPYTSQARVQAFVVPIAAEVSGQVTEVFVKDNDDVKAGEPLFAIDAEMYEIALNKARQDYQSLLSGVNANSELVQAAEAGLRAAQANFSNASKDAERQERLYKEDSGAISVRRLETAQATREMARSQVAAAEADLRRAREAAGAAGEENSQMLSARQAVKKAELDLQNTKVLAPTNGLVTDLQTDKGQFVGAGSPTMTLIAIHDVWISADMTENNLGNVDVGDEVAIVLDAMPGHVLEGRVRSISNGVNTSSAQAPGALPTVENNRDWLRQAQRFPVKVEFTPESVKLMQQLKGVRVGGQADVLVYSGNSYLFNALGAIYIRLMSLFSFIY